MSGIPTARRVCFMPDGTVPPFDDPALKAALRRALPGTSLKAPASLREKIAAMAKGDATQTMTGKPVSADVAGRIGFRQSVWYKVAVAAVLLVGFGFLGYQLYTMNQPTKYDSQTALSDEFYGQMVTAREQRETGKATPDTVTALDQAKTLSTEISRGVFAPDLKVEGWTFGGAAVRKIGGYDAAQLYYTKGDQSILIVSLPSKLLGSDADGAKYDKVIAGTPIAGFAKGEGLFCIIGAKGMGVDEVKVILDRHANAIVRM